MNFVNYLKSKNLEKFEEIKEHLQNDIGMVIKEDSDYPALYMVTYPRELEEEYREKMIEYDWLKECRGLILEKETNRLLCYALNACKLVFDYDNPDACKHVWDTKTCISVSVCGTQVRAFYYDGEWIYSTQRCIDGKKSRWNNDRSFQTLLKDAWGTKFTEDGLNRNYCYTFVLQHPINRIVVPYRKASVTNIVIRDMSKHDEGYPEVDVNTNMVVGIKPAQYVDFTSWEEFMKAVNEKLPEDSLPGSLDKEGWVINYRTEDGSVERIKMLCWDYRNAKELRGNYTIGNAMYHYLKLKEEDKVDMYLRYYPEDYKTFYLLEGQLKELCRKIQNQYYMRHINKMITSDELNVAIRPLIYELHGKHLVSVKKTDDGKFVGDGIVYKVTPKAVYDYLLTKDVPYICYILNKMQTVVVPDPIVRTPALKKPEGLKERPMHRPQPFVSQQPTVVGKTNKQ